MRGSYRKRTVAVVAGEVIQRRLPRRRNSPEKEPKEKPEWIPDPGKPDPG